MKTVHISFVAIVAIANAGLLSGCGDTQEPAPAPATPPAGQTSAADDHGHDHAGHGAGPHDGTLADWGGGKYHVEFTVDHDKQEATVFILGGDEKTPSPIKVEEIQLSISDPVMQVTLKATPQADDPEGAASRFVGNHESLGIVQEYAGTISGAIDGTPYVGEFKEEPHGHDE